jgi:hypothetical protein
MPRADWPAPTAGQSLLDMHHCAASRKNREKKKSPDAGVFIFYFSTADLSRR